MDYLKNKSNCDADVVIIGAGISGLSAAALLIKDGYKVIVVEKGNAAGGRSRMLSAGGYSFETGAPIIWGFEDGGVLNLLFRKLGILKELVSKKEIKALDIGLQIALPDHRINIPSDRRLFYEELSREFPEDIEWLKGFYDKIDSIDQRLRKEYPYRHPYQFVMSKNKSSLDKLSNMLAMEFKDNLFKRFSKHIDSNKAIERFLDIQAIYFGQRPFKEHSSKFLSVMLNLPKNGIYSINGGSKAMVNILEWYIKKHGGDIVYNANVLEFLMKRGRALGVLASYGNISTEIFSRCVISSASGFSLGKMLSSERHKNRYAKHIDGAYQRYIPFTVLFGVEEKIIPHPMRENIFMLKDYSLPLCDDNMIFISLSPQGDNGRAPIGKRALSASIFLSAKDSKEERQKEDFLKRKTEGIIKSMEHLIPFFSRYIDKVITLDHSYYQNLTGCTEGCIGRIFDGRIKEVSGFGGFSPVMPFNRLLLIGDTSYPGHGIAQSVRSSFEAYKLITG